MILWGILALIFSSPVWIFFLVWLLAIAHDQAQEKRMKAYAAMGYTPRPSYHATYSHQLNSWLCGRCGRPMGAGNPATIGDLCKICRGH